ncbi:Cyclochlorotine biosynthesis protein O [Pseudocercospora fuligena]|uniref:Cyclochlorotine biosynthesis protein O n=1 Tax=Pseudocercospora fuligena TaxID=685502 RepID=A0A8H6RP91_9PEZI|nr:Cyclochlorotine biosynthesis protein O [Pseudocercospora fuligena]
MACADTEKNEQLETPLLDHPEEQESRQGPSGPSATQTAFVLIICCLSFLLGFNLASHLRPSEFSGRGIIKTVSRPSPILSNLDIRWKEVQFNGSLLKENIYRKDAGPEVDIAWKELGVDYHALIIPSSIAQSVGIDLDQVQVNDKYGGGYPANIEGLHHLHCLNLLRQTLHWNYPYYQALGQGPFKNEDFIVKKHATHCLDILRQQLMCTVDIGVMGQIWWQPKGVNDPQPFVDFNTKHICRNFEDIRTWAKERQMPEKVPKDFLSPPKKGDRVWSEIP